MVTRTIVSPTGERVVIRTDTVAQAEEISRAVKAGTVAPSAVIDTRTAAAPAPAPPPPAAEPAPVAVAETRFSNIQISPRGVRFRTVRQIDREGRTIPGSERTEVLTPSGIIEATTTPEEIRTNVRAIEAEFLRPPEPERITQVTTFRALPGSPVRPVDVARAGIPAQFERISPAPLPPLPLREDPSIREIITGVSLPREPEVSAARIEEPFAETRPPFARQIVTPTGEQQIRQLQILGVLAPDRPLEKLEERLAAQERARLQETGIIARFEPGFPESSFEREARVGIFPTQELARTIIESVRGIGAGAFETAFGFGEEIQQRLPQQLKDVIGFSVRPIPQREPSRAEFGIPETEFTQAMGFRQEFIQPSPTQTISDILLGKAIRGEIPRRVVKERLTEVGRFTAEVGFALTLPGAIISVVAADKPEEVAPFILAGAAFRVLSKSPTVVGKATALLQKTERGRKLTVQRFERFGRAAEVGIVGGVAGITGTELAQVVQADDRELARQFREETALAFGGFTIGGVLGRPIAQRFFIPLERQIEFREARTVLETRFGKGSPEVRQFEIAFKRAFGDLFGRGGLPKRVPIEQEFSQTVKNLETLIPLGSLTKAVCGNSGISVTPLISVCN